MGHRRVAVIIPIFNEREVLPELIRQLDEVVGRLAGLEVSVVMVDDGSGDGSLDMIREASQSRDFLGYVSLSRNFGHQAAISAGIAHAEADAYVLLDGDLQDPPALIPDLVEQWQAGFDVVLAERRSRKEASFVRGLLIRLYHRYSGLLSDGRMPANTGLYCLMSHRAMEAVRSLRERNRYFPGLREWVGFGTTSVQYDRDLRFAGEPKQNYRRLIRLALDSIFCYSYVPLRLVSLAGLLISAFGFTLGLFFAAKRILGIEVADTGFTTIIVLISILGGAQLVGLGVLGEYLARTYDESKGRPQFVVGECSDGKIPTQV